MIPPTMPWGDDIRKEKSRGRRALLLYILYVLNKEREWVSPREIRSRFMSLIKELHDNNIRFNEVMGLNSVNGITDKTFRNNLGKFLEKGIVERKGVGRNTKYRLAPHIMEELNKTPEEKRLGKCIEIIIEVVESPVNTWNSFIKLIRKRVEPPLAAKTSE